MLTQIVGVFNAEGPPVPIPNTEVKLCSAENTCRATGRENKSMPTYHRKTVKMILFSCLCISPKEAGHTNSEVAIRYASLAQLAEHVTVNHGVVGSSPSRGAKTEDHQSVVFCFAVFFRFYNKCWGETNRYSK